MEIVKTMAITIISVIVALYIKDMIDAPAAV
jgi:hypothetical protein